MRMQLLLDLVAAAGGIKEVEHVLAGYQAQGIKFRSMREVIHAVKYGYPHTHTLTHNASSFSSPLSPRRGRRSGSPARSPRLIPSTHPSSTDSTLSTNSSTQIPQLTHTHSNRGEVDELAALRRTSAGILFNAKNGLLHPSSVFRLKKSMSGDEWVTLFGVVPDPEGLPRALMRLSLDAPRCTSILGVVKAIAKQGSSKPGSRAAPLSAAIDSRPASDPEEAEESLVFSFNTAGSTPPLPDERAPALNDSTLPTRNTSSAPAPNPEETRTQAARRYVCVCVCMCVYARVCPLIHVYRSIPHCIHYPACRELMSEQRKRQELQDQLQTLKDEKREENSRCARVCVCVCMPM
jgi:hypothetical protein